MNINEMNFFPRMKKTCVYENMKDYDGDKLIDFCDPDDDNDGIPDEYENVTKNN